MTINTEFNINDEVVCIYRDKICSGVIKHIVTELNQDNKVKTKYSIFFNEFSYAVVDESIVAADKEKLVLKL